MNVVLTWVKSNVASVIFIVVMIGALVALPIVSSKLNASIQEDMKDRVGKLKELSQLEKTRVDVGNPAISEPISKTVLVNEDLLERLKRVTEAESEDAKLVLETAVDHNRKGRGVILPVLFPEPPLAEREVLPARFHRELIQAYDRLLQDVKAGSPPSAESLKEDLDRQRAIFLSQTLQKDVDDVLDPEEQSQVLEVLTTHRMSRCAEEAGRIGLYASKDVLNLPVWNQAAQPTMLEMYDWQWQYWLIEDLLEALADANRDFESVTNAPVKRVLEITAYDAFGGAGDGASGGSGLGSAPPAKARKGGTGADPSTEVKLDYAVSFTGRHTNPLYDVRQVLMRLVVDTARLPEVMDALARRNFITILDAVVTPADQYAAAKSGYFYGPAPVSEVTLQLETVWLRSWTSEFMPSQVREVLGLPARSGADQG